MVQPPAPAKRILCVDDDPDTLEMLEVALGLLGHEVTSAETVTDGLRQAQGSAFDLLILDNRFEECTGVELCRQIRTFDRRTPILFLSADAYNYQIQQAMDAGAQAYLVKPVDLDQLEQYVAQLFTKRQYTVG